MPNDEPAEQRQKRELELTDPKDGIGRRVVGSLSGARGRLVISLALIMVLYLAVGLVQPNFLSSANFWTLSQQGSILLLIGLGATFVVMMGMIDLSVGSLVTLSAMTLAILVPNLGPAAVPAAIAVSIAFGLLNGVIVTVLRLPSFLVTLGMLSVIQGFALIIGNTYQQFQSSFLQGITGRVLGQVPLITIWAAVITVTMIIMARYTLFGRGAYVIGGNEKVSQIVGLPIKRYKIAAFGLSGFTCGVAGVLLAGLIGAGTPQIGAGFLLDAVAAIAVGGTALSGGVGGPHGTVVGAAIITVLAAALVTLGVSEEMQSIVKGLVVVFAVYFTMTRSRDDITK